MSKGLRTDFNGILLYTKAYRERDLLVKFLTREYGKKMFLVHGAKRPKFKMRAAILPFTYGLYNGDIKESGLSYISTDKQLAHFQAISEDITKNAYATYIMSLIDLAFPDGEPIPEWYDKLLTGLNLINEGFDEQIITNIFEVQLLNAYGVAPDWVDCVICHRTDLPFDYSEAYGGLLCSNHWSQIRTGCIWMLEQFIICVYFRWSNLTKLKHVKVSDQTKKALREVLE